MAIGGSISFRRDIKINLPTFDYKVVNVSFQVYKIKEEELEIGSLLDAVVGRMASKDFVSFSWQILDFYAATVSCLYVHIL